MGNKLTSNKYTQTWICKKCGHETKLIMVGKELKYPSQNKICICCGKKKDHQIKNPQHQSHVLNTSKLNIFVKHSKCN